MYAHTHTSICVHEFTHTSQVSVRNALAGKNLIVAVPDPRVKPWTATPGFLRVTDPGGELGSGVLKEVSQFDRDKFNSNQYAFVSTCILWLMRATCKSHARQDSFMCTCY